MCISTKLNNGVLNVFYYCNITGWLSECCYLLSGSKKAKCENVILGSYGRFIWASCNSFCIFVQIKG